MWRDRTNLYISYRQSYAHHPSKPSNFSGLRSNGYTDNDPEERRGLMAAEGEGDVVVEMDQLPPRWLDIQDEVMELLEDVNKKLPKLGSLHAKHVLPGFDDEAIKKREEHEIEKLTQEITRSLQSCQRAIQKIGSMAKDNQHRGGLSKGEETMAKNLQVSLAARVGDVSASFRKKQSVYLKKLRALSGMVSPNDRASTPIHGNLFADPSMLESDADRSFSQSTLQQTAMKRGTTNDTVIVQREKEIEDIAQSIIELSNMFQEIQTMVIDQGTMLDRIDYNVERMATDVKAADKELTVATNYQKRTTKRKIILLLLLIVVGMFILLLVKPRSRGGKPETPSAPAPAPAPAPPAPPPLHRRIFVPTEFLVLDTS